MSQRATLSSKLENQTKTTINDKKDDDRNDNVQLLPNTTIVTHCIYVNDPIRLKRCFEDPTDPYKDEINKLVNQRDSAGKSPLDLIASLGRTELANLLIHGGADINSVTSKGYNCLHYVAAWGQLEVLKILVQNGANLFQENIHGETPRGVALRYNHLECVSYMELAEEKKKLEAEISHTLGRIQDMDKSLIGRITREEKNLVINTCKGKQEWLNNTSDASAQDMRDQQSEFTQKVQPILAKLSETFPEKHEKREGKDK